MKDQIRFTQNRNLICLLSVAAAVIFFMSNTSFGQTGNNGQFNNGGDAGFTGQALPNSAFNGQAPPNTNLGTSNQDTLGQNGGNPAFGTNAADTNNENSQTQMFNYRVKIDDEDIEGLLFQGKELEALIPAEFRGRIDRITIEYIGTKYKNIADLQPRMNNFGGQDNGLGNQQNDLTGTNPTGPYDRVANAQNINQGTNSVLNRRDSNTLNNNGFSPLNPSNNERGLGGQQNPGLMTNPPQNNQPTDPNAWQSTRPENNMNPNYSARKFAAQDNSQNNFGDGTGIQVGDIGAMQNQNQGGMYGTQNNPNTLDNRFAMPAGQTQSPGAFRDNRQTGFQQNLDSNWQNSNSNIPPNPNLGTQVTRANGNDTNMPSYGELVNMLNNAVTTNGNLQNQLRTAMQQGTGNSNPTNQRLPYGNNQFTSTGTNTGTGANPLGHNNNRPTSTVSPDTGNSGNKGVAQSGKSGDSQGSPSDTKSTDQAKSSNNGALALFSLLCISLGANACLAWFARGFYVRYRELADELRSTLSVAA